MNKEISSNWTQPVGWRKVVHWMWVQSAGLLVSRFKGRLHLWNSWKALLVFLSLSATSTWILWCLCLSFFGCLSFFLYSESRLFTCVPTFQFPSWINASVTFQLQCTIFLEMAQVRSTIAQRKIRSICYGQNLKTEEDPIMHSHMQFLPLQNVCWMVTLFCMSRKNHLYLNQFRDIRGGRGHIRQNGCHKHCTDAHKCCFLWAMFCETQNNSFWPQR